MREHYIEGKVDNFYDWDFTTIKRMEEEQRMARLMNKINQEIERQTTELHQRLCGYVLHTLEKEL